MDAWRTVAYLWDGLLLHVGDSAPSSGHTHSLMQLAVSIDGPIRVENPDGDWIEGDCVLVGPNTPHAFRAKSFALLWIEPESDAARRLELAYARHEPVRVISADLDSLRPMAQMLLDSPRACDAAWQFCDEVLRRLTGELPRPHAVHPAIGKALRLIAEQPQFKISAKTLAAAVGLSEGRFVHAFRDTTGVPLRRFLMWQRVRQAVFLLVAGKSATEAAIVAGFTDGAHLNRACKTLLGAKPSDFRAANIELHTCTRPAPLL